MRNLTIQAFGERAVLIKLPPSIDEKTLSKVLQIKQLISNSFSKEILETVSGYNSVAIYLRYQTDIGYFVKRLKNSLKNSSTLDVIETRVVHVPVCYDLEYALDLQEISAKKNRSISEIIQLHTKPTYKVYFLGFLPGFPYLGGLDKRLHIPRKATPREKVESGSVAIGGSQTGVYSTSSPGGWHIIGKTPLPFFSIEKNPPALLKPGDFIKFIPVSQTEFNKIKTQIENGTYQIKEEVSHG